MRIATMIRISSRQRDLFKWKNFNCFCDIFDGI